MNLSGVAGKQIALGVCGGIAAYKVVEVARGLTQAGADVRVVMTPSALNFVGAITFSTLTSNPVRTELFPATAPTEIPHTDLGRISDIVVIAPATAKVIAKYAQGISDDLMTALLLSARCPIVMAPAMHTEMWEDEATVRNIEILTSRGVRFIGPNAGALAGPDVGPGRLADPSEILEVVADELSRTEDFSGVRVLVTAGGTREPIDAVRFIGNRSSGKMGYALAYEGLRRGAKVTLVTAPTSLVPPAAAEVVSVTTASEMKNAVEAYAADSDVIIMNAAVSDFRPEASSDEKLKKSEGTPEIKLEPTDDILEAVGKAKRAGQIVVGFAAETSNLEGYARAKLTSKNADLIVANYVGREGTGFESEENEAIVVGAEGDPVMLPRMSKRMMARKVMDLVRPLLK